jgi:hypothetical protein
MHKENPQRLGVFLFGQCLYAFGTDFLSLSVNFLGLKIDLKFSKRLHVGMADLVSALGSSSADIAYSTHDHEI